MLFRTSALGRLLLPALFALLVSRPAGAQVDSPDDLCAPDADPCVVSTAQTLVAEAVLDFGDRTLRVTSTGRLMSVGGSLSITAREVQVEAGGQLNLRGTTSISGGEIVLTAVELINLAGLLDVSGQGGGIVTVKAARFDVTSTGNLLLNALQEDGSGGDLTIDAGEINLNGRVQLNSGSSGIGGTATLNAMSILGVRGIFEVKGGEGDGGTIYMTCGGNITVSELASIRLDATGFGFGGDLTLSAGDALLGPGVGTLLLQGTLSAAGGGSTDDGGDAGSFDISSADDCVITGRLLAISGPSAEGGDISVSCGEVGPGDMTMSAEIDVHGSDADGAGGSVQLSTANGAIEISNKISANANSGGGGSVIVVASRGISVSDRINVNGGDANGGDVSLTARGTADATVTLTSSGSINADGTGTGNQGGSISLDSCTTSVLLRAGGTESCTANGDTGTGTISLTGVNTISIGGAMSSSNAILLIYRDFTPFLQSTAVLVPPGTLVLDETLQGCGTPQPTRTRTRTPTVPTPTFTATRPMPTSTPTRTRTETPGGATSTPTSTPTSRPTPAGPNDANCNGILASDESPGVIEGIYDVAFFDICNNADANRDGQVTAADLPAIVRNIAAE